MNDGHTGGLPYQAVPGAAVFDGSQYLVSRILASTDLTSALYDPMATRIALDGALLDSEPQGRLLAPRPSVPWGDGRLAVTATHSLLFWYEPYEQSPGRILAQGIFER